MTSLIRSIGIAAGILVLAGVQNARAQIENGLDFTTSFRRAATQSGQTTTIRSSLH